MKFNVNARVTISLYKRIEAGTPEEAMEIAAGLAMPGLCYGCSEAGKDDDETWQLRGELDGEATKIVIEE
jgi:hypothetical protein